jgi:hypothetical protein
MLRNAKENGFLPWNACNSFTLPSGVRGPPRPTPPPPQPGIQGQVTKLPFPVRKIKTGSFSQKLEVSQLAVDQPAGHWLPAAAAAVA